MEYQFYPLFLTFCFGSFELFFVISGTLASNASPIFRYKRFITRNFLLETLVWILRIGIVKGIHTNII